nr:MAG TPA: hypothetical protein [Caudoviricetes sp.]
MIISIKKISVIGDNAFFCFSIIYRLVFGGSGLWSLPPIVSYVSLSYNQTK